VNILRPILMILKQTTVSRMSETCIKMYMNITRISNLELKSQRLKIVICWYTAAVSWIRKNYSWKLLHVYIHRIKNTRQNEIHEFQLLITEHDYFQLEIEIKQLNFNNDDLTQQTKVYFCTFYKGNVEKYNFACWVRSSLLKFKSLISIWQVENNHAQFLRSKGFGTGSTQPREDNCGATWKEK
jgi:hypothetical protein